MGQKFYTLHLENQDSRRKLSLASQKIADAISNTLGPNGWHAALERNEGLSTPTITKDGATVMYDLNFKDKWETMVYEIYRDCTDHISKTIGDGTTSVVYITNDLYQRFLKFESPEFLELSDIIKGAKEAANDLMHYIEEESLYKRATARVIRSVLTIASAGETDIIDRLTEIFLENSDYGMIVVKDSGVGKEEHILEQGYVLGSSPKNPELFYVEEQPKPFINWDNAYTAVSIDKITSFKQIIPMLEVVLTKGGSKKLLIMYSEMDPSVLDMIKKNNLSDKNELEIMCVRVPMYAERQKNLLEDVAAFTDSTPITKETGVNFENIQIEDLGMVGSLSATLFDVKIADGRGGKVKDENNVTVLQKRINFVEQDRNCYTGNVQERNDANYRLARLTGEITSIYPGGASEAEVKRRKGVYEDCIKAVQEAIQGGVVPGGGWTLYYWAQHLLELTSKSKKNLSLGYIHGYTSTLKAMQSIFTKLTKDIDSTPEYYSYKIKEYAKNNKLDAYKVACNFVTKEIGEATKINILEPYSMLAEIIKYSVSLVTTLITTDSTITKHPTKWYNKSWKEKMQDMSHLRY